MKDFLQHQRAMLDSTSSNTLTTAASLFSQRFVLKKDNSNKDFFLEELRRFIWEYSVLATSASGNGEVSLIFRMRKLPDGSTELTPKLSR